MVDGFIYPALLSKSNPYIIVGNIIAGIKAKDVVPEG